mmetsp:Transcript_132641/g.330839  ORF Transcript_132641/g.330839 Transcript_132641/m.330839 type:complete len:261 (+) Transcript_132641:989-1771(+)
MPWFLWVPWPWDKHVRRRACGYPHYGIGNLNATATLVLARQEHRTEDTLSPSIHGAANPWVSPGQSCRLCSPEAVMVPLNLGLLPLFGFVMSRRHLNPSPEKVDASFHLCCHPDSPCLIAPQLCEPQSGLNGTRVPIGVHDRNAAASTGAATTAKRAPVDRVDGLQASRQPWPRQLHLVKDVAAGIVGELSNPIDGHDSPPRHETRRFAIYENPCTGVRDRRAPIASSFQASSLHLRPVQVEPLPSREAAHNGAVLQTPN